MARVTKNGKVVLVISLVGFATSLFYLDRFFNQFDVNLHDEKFLYPSAFLIVSIIILQLFGHYLRAYKSRLLIEPIRDVSNLFLFKSLGIGFLFNSILPFRMGEFVRAHVIGKQLHISRSVVFVTILFERAVDILFVMIGIVAVLFFSNQSTVLELVRILYPFMLIMVTTALIILFLIHRLYAQDKKFLQFFYKTTNLFNDKIKNKQRFIIWSVIYGINTIYNKVDIKRYLALTFVMWLFYVASIFLLASSIFSNENVVNNLLASLSSYISVSVPSGPAYIGTYHYYFSNIVGNIIFQKDNILSFSLLSWAILIVPISIIGTAVLFKGNSLKKYKVFDFLNLNKAEAGLNNNNYLNKLFRYNDISNEMSYFLEVYFKNLEIARVINLQEIDDKIKLLKTFKGGSNAVTSLVWNGERECVRKTTLLEYAPKLQDQYEWIKERQHLKNIPKLIGHEKDETSYSIDIEYSKDYIPFFDFIHSNSINESKKILEEVIVFVDKELYCNAENIESRADLDYYVKTKIFDKVNDCAALNVHLAGVLENPTLIINGKKYDNFSVIMDKITNNDEIMQAVSRYEKNTLHGDLTVDNIIVKRDEFILLDPNNENYISDSLVDYAKLYQSLHSGYEFLCMLDNIKFKNNEIYFEENISSKYSELFSHLEEILSNRMAPERFRLIKFHEAIHYFRMLTYRAKINPETFFAFYAVAIRLLNEFYNDFINEKSM